MREEYARNLFNLYWPDDQVAIIFLLYTYMRSHHPNVTKLRRRKEKEGGGEKIWKCGWSGVRGLAGRR